jgi:membrane-associated phospholipid phosphatase
MLVAVYALLTIGVIIYPSPVLDLDKWWLDQHMWGNHPQYHVFIYYYVMLGQRGPATLVFLPIFIWVAWRRRTTEPLVLLGASLVLLNVSVGVVKYAVGRVGPRDTTDPHQVFLGGTLFPSGHVANAVVLYGALAWILPQFRKWLIPTAVFICASVGIGTIYLRTHWFSDVIGGWIAGGLVLLTLPNVMPYAQRWTDQAVERFRLRRMRRRMLAGGHERLDPAVVGTRRHPPAPEPAAAGPGRGQR